LVISTLTIGTSCSAHRHPPVQGLTGGYVLSPAARARVSIGAITPGSRTHRGIMFCRPLRGLAYLLVRLPPVRGLTGGYILSPAARARVSIGAITRFADSPGATFCRPLRGLTSLLVRLPPVRGLTGGYILSPAARAHVLCRTL